MEKYIEHFRFKGANPGKIGCRHDSAHQNQQGHEGLAAGVVASGEGGDTIGGHTHGKESEQRVD